MTACQLATPSHSGSKLGSVVAQTLLWLTADPQLSEVLVLPLPGLLESQGDDQPVLNVSTGGYNPIGGKRVAGSNPGNK